MSKELPLAIKKLDSKLTRTKVRASRHMVHISDEEAPLGQRTIATFYGENSETYADIFLMGYETLRSFKDGKIPFKTPNSGGGDNPQES